MRDQTMTNNDRIARTLSVELSSGREFSDQKTSLEADDERWLLLRVFLSIRNQATRSVILNMVSAVAWQDLQIRSAPEVQAGGGR